MAKRTSRNKSVERPGLSADLEDAGFGRQSVAWITPQILETSRIFWSRQYARELSAGETIDVLTNIKALAECLLDMGEKEVAT